MYSFLFYLATIINILVAWVPPPHFSFYKLNFDASASNNSTAAAVIIYNNLDQLIQATAHNLGTTLLFVGEATTLRKGLILA